MKSNLLPTDHTNGHSSFSQKSLNYDFRYVPLHRVYLCISYKHNLLNKQIHIAQAFISQDRCLVWHLCATDQDIAGEMYVHSGTVAAPLTLLALHLNMGGVGGAHTIFEATVKPSCHCPTI